MSFQGYVAIAVVTAFIAGVAAAAWGDSSPPTTAQEKAFISGRAMAYANDATAWDSERDAFDNSTIRPLRHEFRTRTQTCIDQATVAAMRSCVVGLKDYLARPGPAPSVAKDLHTATRQFGDDALHLLNSHAQDMQQRAALFP